MSSYYYSKLDGPGRAAYKEIVAAINRRAPQVRVEESNYQKLNKILEMVQSDHPEFFFTDFSSWRFQIFPGSGTVVKINYRFPEAELNRKVQEMEGIIQRVLSKAEYVRNASALDKCKWIHNTLVRNVRYDFAAYEAWKESVIYPEAYSIEGVFRDKTAVCEGIAHAAALLGDRLGVNIAVVSGKAKATSSETYEGHAWNLCRINGVCAHIDITWDINWSQSMGVLRYDYFGLSDRDISVNHIWDKEDVPVCPENTGLSYFERAGRLLTKWKQCEQYVESAFRAGETLAYFKYCPATGLPANIDQKMSDMVMKKAAKYFRGGSMVYRSPNLALNTFLYRVVSPGSKTSAAKGR